MSPEQARGKVVDRRTDIWALGCVLYECLTGKRAFDGETASDTLAKVLEREPKLEALPATTPARVRELIQRCLTKDPKLRLRDIGDARITLDEVLAARTSSGRLPAFDAAVAPHAAARRASPVVLGAVGLAGLVIGAAAWGLLGTRSSGGEIGAKCVSITIPTGISVQRFGLASDGRTVTLLAQPKKPDGTNAGPARIYSRRLDQYEFKEAAGTEGAFFANQPVGGSFIFAAPVSADSPQLRLFRAPADGSAPPTGLMDLDSSWTWMLQAGNGDVLGVRSNSELVRIPKDGGAPSTPVKLDAGRPGVSQYQIWNNIPGDERALLNVVIYDARGWHYSVGVLDPSTGKVNIVEEDGGNAAYSPTGHLLFSRGSTLLAMPFDLKTAAPRGAPVAVWSGLSTAFSFLPAPFMLSEDGSLLYRPGKLGGNRAMAFVDANGRVVRWEGEERGVDSGPEPSPDARRFACSIANSRGIDEIFVSDIDRPGYRRISNDPNADCTSAQWSPDGRQLAYSRRGRDDRDGVYVQNADGGEARLVYAQKTKEERNFPFSWLPDGSAVVLSQTAPGRSSIGILPIAGDPADATRVKTLLSGPNQIESPRVSPEGRRIAYVNDESGKKQVYVAELRADRTLGHPVQVRTTQGTEPFWSHDGKWLFVRDGRNQVMKVAVGPAPDLAMSTAESALDLEREGITLWSVLPDGRFFVGLKNEDEGDIRSLNLVLGWTEELTRRITESGR